MVNPDDDDDGPDDDGNDDVVGEAGGQAKVISCSSSGTKSGKPAPSYHRPNYKNQPSLKS